MQTCTQKKTTNSSRRKSTPTLSRQPYLPTPTTRSWGTIGQYRGATIFSFIVSIPLYGQIRQVLPLFRIHMTPTFRVIWNSKWEICPITRSLSSKRLKMLFFKRNLLVEGGLWTGFGPTFSERKFPVDSPCTIRFLYTSRAKAC